MYVYIFEEEAVIICPNTKDQKIYATALGKAAFIQFKPIGTIRGITT